MVFSSILFLFLYLPLTLGIYYITPRRWRNLALLVLNLIFYGWGEPIYVLIMIFSILVDYSHGLLIARHRENDRFCRKVVASSVIINLGLLVFFKYYDFIVTNLRAVFPALSFLEPLGLGLPIGISFYSICTRSKLHVWPFSSVTIGCDSIAFQKTFALIVDVQLFVVLRNQGADDRIGPVGETAVHRSLLDFERRTADSCV